MTLAAERVHAASAAWIWIPDTAVVLEAGGWTLVRFPPWVDQELAVVGHDGSPDGADSPGRAGRALADGVAEALETARATGLEQLVWWVKLTSPPGLEDHLVALGGRLDETLDVLAVDLTEPAAPLDLPDDVELRWAEDVATMRDSHVVISTAFEGGSVPPDEQLSADAADGVVKRARGEGGGLVAYLDGAAVGTGGVTVAGDAGRLWSGCVLEHARGRGVYRSLLAARLDYAREHGARLGLVKGRVTTSGPILRRAGFTAYGQERSYLLDLRSV